MKFILHTIAMQVQCNEIRIIRIISIISMKLPWIKYPTAIAAKEKRVEKAKNGAKLTALTSII